MEMRLLESETERAAFEYGLTRARAIKGSGFGEKQRSRLGRVHMAFADLYGIFDETSDHPDRMLAGFATHSLDLFSQSYSKPDLTHLPPEEVFEVGELWALSLGAGVAARHGCAITLGLAGATTLLIYPIVSPWDLTVGYPDYRAVGDANCLAIRRNPGWSESTRPGHGSGRAKAPTPNLRRDVGTL